jgi:hypothetical protein
MYILHEKIKNVDEDFNIFESTPSLQGKGGGPLMKDTHCALSKMLIIMDCPTLTVDIYVPI